MLGLGSATLAACTRGVEGDETDSADLGPVEDAVESSTTRVVRVTGSERLVDGLGHSISLELRVSGVAPMSADDLDTIVEAIWTSAPWEPHGISLMAFADDDEEEPVDLRAAATGLTPMFSTAYGEGGVSIIGMQERYGAWTEPA